MFVHHECVVHSLVLETVLFSNGIVDDNDDRESASATDKCAIGKPKPDLQESDSTHGMEALPHLFKNVETMSKDIQVI